MKAQFFNLTLLLTLFPLVQGTASASEELLKQAAKETQNLETMDAIKGIVESPRITILRSLEDQGEYKAMNLQDYLSMKGGDYGAGNGGDACENKVLTIRDEINLWINKGGYKELKLPKSLSLNDYASKMKDAIRGAKVSCTNDRLFIGQAEKACVNFVTNSGDHRILCNDKRFTDTKESEKFTLVHHEYAGVAELEVNSAGEESNYVISNQLTRFMQVQEVIKLGLLPIFDFDNTDEFHFSPANGKDQVKWFHSDFERSYFNIITFKRDLPLLPRMDGKIDDDIYFQDGKRVQEEELDKTRLYCGIDTDFESNVGKTIKKGQKLLIREVNEKVHFDLGIYSISIEFLMDGLNEEIDDLDCELPLSKAKGITVKDVLETTGNAVEFEAMWLNQ
jgi:hypothetical protein